MLVRRIGLVGLAFRPSTAAKNGNSGEYTGLIRLLRQHGRALTPFSRTHRNFVQNLEEHSSFFSITENKYFFKLILKIRFLLIYSSLKHFN